MTRFFLALALAAAALLSSCAAPTQAENVAPSPDKIQPLAVGTAAPDAQLRTTDGEPVSLASLLGKSPVALVFYRGGW